MQPVFPYPSQRLSQPRQPATLLAERQEVASRALECGLALGELKLDVLLLRLVCLAGSQARRGEIGQSGVKERGRAGGVLFGK